MKIFTNEGAEIAEPLNEIDWSYEAWPQQDPIWHPGASRNNPDDQIEYHVDLGCGTLKKGRIGIDRYYAPGVNIAMDLDVDVSLPFPDNSIEHVISHHFFEHVGDGFIELVDEIYRVLKPGGHLRAITPLFPSTSAVSDPDHKRYFMAESEEISTWDSFVGDPNGTFWTEAFSVPYTQARFIKTSQEFTPKLSDPQDWWTSKDQRELRVTLKKR
jgi:SAM-dependent methyltransferase